MVKLHNPVERTGGLLVYYPTEAEKREERALDMLWEKLTDGKTPRPRRGN